MQEEGQAGARLLRPWMWVSQAALTPSRGQRGLLKEGNGATAPPGPCMCSSEGLGGGDAGTLGAGRASS